jgi:hypothetical protein
MKTGVSAFAVAVFAVLAAPAVLSVGSLPHDSATSQGTRLLASPSPTGAVATPAVAATAAPASRVVVTDPAPVFRATGGPYIPVDQAVTVAQLRIRQTPADKQPDAQPILRQAAARVTYGDVVTWGGGSRTYRIDLQREVYLVILSTRYVPKHLHGVPYECRWVGVVVDATDGTAWELHCGRELWPTTLPAGLGAQ